MTATLTFSPLELKQAQRADRLIAHTLTQRGLPLPPAESLLTRDPQLGAVLFWRMDTKRMAKLEPYTDAKVVHQISTNLRGWPVIVCNTIGLAYGVLLGGKRGELLPTEIIFPGMARDQLLLGVDAQQATVSLPFKDLGHLLVAGATRSGKSNFLRLVVYQALANGYQLALADLDGRTFPMLANHPSLAFPLVTTPEGVDALLASLMREIETRQAAFAAAPGYPETLSEYNATATEKLAPMLVVLDEISATIVALGGAKSEAAKQLAALGWRARKFGITLILAGQDFRKEIIGAVKDSLTGTVAFSLATPEAARNVGLPQAANLTRPGRASTDRWGIVQTFYLPKTALIQTTVNLGLTAEERRIVRHLLRHHEGKMSYEALAPLNIPEREARRLCTEWDSRGWTAKDPKRANGRYLQKSVLDLLGAKDLSAPRPARSVAENVDQLATAVES